MQIFFTYIDISINLLCENFYLIQP